MYFDATEFATRLSTLRKAQGMTQEEMTEALCCFHVSTDYLLMGKDHDKVDSRTKILDVVTQLTEIAKNL